MSEQSLSSKALNGTIWSFIESFSRQAITFLLGLVLARLLFPSDYGLIGMLQFFLALTQSFVDCGFSNALICKKDRNDADFSTAFYFNFVIGVVAYLILFLIAPFVANFYNEPQLNLLLRVVGLTVFFNSLCIVQNAILISSLRMRLLTRVTLMSQILSGIIGIICAYSGLGVWALAIQSVGGSILTTILLWLTTKWVPHTGFSRESFKYLWDFGSKMLFVGLISTAYSNMHSMIIGKAFNKTDLGNFTKANNLARIIPNTLYTVLNKVSLPTFSQINDDIPRLKAAFRKYLRVASFLVFPIMGFLFTFAKPLILFLWTDRWIEAVPLFQIICFGCIWNTLDLLSISILQVLHKPQILMRYEIVNKIVGFSILIISIQFGFVAVIIGRSVYNIYEYLIYTTTNKKYLSYTYLEQIRDILPNLLLMLVCMPIAYFSASFVTSSIQKLVVGAIVGFGLYVLVGYMLKYKSFNDILLILKKLE